MNPEATIETSVGRAQVLHRLALAVECVDGVTGQLARTPLRVAREVPTRTPESPQTALGLDQTATGRFVLRHRPSLPNTVTLRLVDPDRRYVARRLEVPLWTLDEVAAADAVPPTGPYVPVRSRLMRAWLAPGSAYDPPSGTTAVRGRVTRASAPVRWPRLTALEDGAAVGWAHGDDRGEFLLVITATAKQPPEDAVHVDLVVQARNPALAVPPDPADPYADLPREDLARSSVPPLATDLDNPLLRGRTTPPDYVTSTAPRPHLTVPIGEVFAPAADIDFTV